jgi:hypothetical protein
MNLRIRRKAKTGWIEVDKDKFLKISKLIEFLSVSKHTLEHVLLSIQKKKYEKLHFDVNLNEGEFIVFLGKTRNEIYKAKISDLLFFCKKKGNNCNRFFAEYLKKYHVYSFSEPEKIISNTPK